MQKALRGFADLKEEAASRDLSTNVDTSKPPPGKECAICLCEIDDPAERFLMEPCLHAYHKVCVCENSGTLFSHTYNAPYWLREHLQECAVRSVEASIENRQFPIMCYHQGCTPQPLCLEDIKLLLADATKFETLCTRALLLHVSQTPELERCPTVDCKQVCESRG